MPAILSAFEAQTTRYPTERDVTQWEDDPSQSSLVDAPCGESVSIGEVTLFLLDAIVLWLILAQILYLVVSPAGINPEPLSLWACHAVVAVALVFARVPPLIWK